jgi:hypothetical protein
MQIIKPAGAIAAIALLGFAGMSITSPRVHADSPKSDSRVQIGFNIAPVPLNMKGRNHDLVGVGSYIVNAQADCNGCHNSPDLGGEYAAGGDPFNSQHPAVVNKAAYLGGGTTFAVFPDNAVIQSRNLTPDKTGRPAGGATLEEFITIIRTGKDFDHIHPPCPAANTPDGCIQPFVEDGNLLQIMPWPTFANMSDKDLEAIYEYLSAIPCVAHSTGAQSQPGVPILANVFNTCK